jgi:hypothetical protein
VKHQGCILCIFTGLILFSNHLVFSRGTVEDYRRAEKFLRPNVEKMVFNTYIIPHWIEKTPRFWYQRSDRGGKTFILVDCRQRSKKPAFDHNKLARNLSSLLEKEFKPQALPFDRFEFIEKGKAIAFKVNKQKITCDLTTYQCSKEEEEKKTPSSLLSPDKKWLALVDNHDLYARSASGEQEIRLTGDGSEKHPYGATWDWYYLMNESDPAQTKKSEGITAAWSPDSSKLATYRVDYRSAKKLYLFQSAPESGYRAQVWSYYRSLPGEAEGVMFKYYIFDIPGKKKIPIDIQHLHYVVGVMGFPTWFPDSRGLYFYYYTRGYKSVILVEIDAKTGKTRQVLEESSETYMDYDKRFIHIL